MKARICSFVAAGVILISARLAQAEIHIEAIAALLQRPPGTGTTFEQYYPEELHFNMHKELTFEGSFQNLDPTLPATVNMWFDWIDPIGGPFVTYPPFEIDLDPLQTMEFTGENAFKFTISFCPAQVSIHIENDGFGGPVTVGGIFTHECVPEPAMLLILPLLILMAPFAMRGVKAIGGEG